MIICSPAKAYYTDKVRVLFAEKYSRSADGGVGFAKAAGNYAAQCYPTNLAQQKGFQQIIWTDASSHEYLEEAGTMNIFFKINREFITPNLDGSILHGITRLSVIELLRSKGYNVTERPITIDEIVEASSNGSLEEAFGAGTAVGIAMIQEIGYKDSSIHVSDESPVGQMVLDTLNGVRSGKIEDTLNWMVHINN